MRKGEEDRSRFNTLRPGWKQSLIFEKLTFAWLSPGGSPSPEPWLDSTRCSHSRPCNPPDPYFRADIGNAWHYAKAGRLSKREAINRTCRQFIFGSTKLTVF